MFILFLIILWIEVLYYENFSDAQFLQQINSILIRDKLLDLTYNNFIILYMILFIYNDEQNIHMYK